MTFIDDTTPLAAIPRHESVVALTSRLAHAENALRALATSQVDAIITPDGQSHLLLPEAEHFRQNERHLQAVIDSAADIILVVGRDGCIVFQNRATARWLSYGIGSLVGCNLFHLAHKDDLCDLYAALFNVIEEFRQASILRFRLRHHFSAYREVEATISKFCDTSCPRVVLVCRDELFRQTSSSKKEEVNGAPPAPQFRYL